MCPHTTLYVSSGRAAQEVRGARALQKGDKHSNGRWKVGLLGKEHESPIDAAIEAAIGPPGGRHLCVQPLHFFAQKFKMNKK